MRPEQAELFEPRPVDLPALCLGHMRQAEQERRAASIFQTRGFEELRKAAERRANLHENEAEMLAQLGEWYALGGIR